MLSATFTRPIVPTIVSQHVEEAAHLRMVRSVLVRAPHVKLLQLGRLDERIAAHLDGVSVAGDPGARMAVEALERPGVGEVFTATVVAIERRDAAQLDRLVSLLGVVPEAARGLASAFGWVSAPLLRGLTAQLLAARAPAQRWLGLAACAAHRVDPGAALAPAIAHADPTLRARALRAAGQLGRVDLLGDTLVHLDDAGPACRHAAAWAAVLLGDRGHALQRLQSLAGPAPAPPPGAAPTGASDAASVEALQLALLACGRDAARALVRQLAASGAPLRTTIRAAGWAGDLQVVPWLFKHMADDAHARLAGEAFTWLTGADLAALDLERNAPEGFVSGPSDDPDDDDVALDEDESLPWPDLARVQAWWDANAGRLPHDRRCFAGGAADDAAHLGQVLVDGTQRMRHAAALLLSLSRPGNALFNVAAPTRRQRRRLTAAFSATDAQAPLSGDAGGSRTA